MIKFKFLIFSLLLLCNISTVKGQIFSERAYLSCKYSFKSILDTNKREKVRNEFVSIEIGKSGSYYYSINHDNYDKVSEDFRKNHPGEKMAPGELLKLIKNMGTPLKIYKNYISNRIVVTDLINLDYYFYEEETPIFNWQIEPDTIKILNQICQKATCKFRGRNYEAWFAQEINISEGPWKFKGLPGLILKIRDSKNDYVFEAIEIKKVDYEITAGKFDAQKVSREKYLSIYKYYVSDPTMGTNFKDINPNMPKEFYDKMAKYKLPYNPMELTDN